MSELHVSYPVLGTPPEPSLSQGGMVGLSVEMTKYEAFFRSDSTLTDPFDLLGRPSPMGRQIFVPKHKGLPRPGWVEIAEDVGNDPHFRHSLDILGGFMAHNQISWGYSAGIACSGTARRTIDVAAPEYGEYYFFDAYEHQILLAGLRACLRWSQMQRISGELSDLG